MDRGIYAASSGGLHSSRRVDVVGHNLANVSTVGYKAERLVGRQQSFQDTLAGTLSNMPARAEGDHARTPGVVHIGTMTDFSPGPVSYTGNPLHVALNEKNQFFVIDTPEGEAYTRAGNFSLNGEGQIVTADGKPVMGEGGPITVEGSQVSITASGQVVANGANAGRLRVAQFDDLTGLERKEGVLFVAKGAQPQTVQPQVIPASVEMANISVVDAMVEMISAQKSFESYAKSVQTIGDLNETSLRTVRSTG